MAEGPPGFPHNDVRPGAAVDGGPVLALDDRAARERVARVEALLEELEGSAAGVPRERALELVGALLDLYGEGLRRIVTVVAERDGVGALAAAFAGDELVSHLLLLHGLHPVPLERRVDGHRADRALDLLEQRVDARHPLAGRAVVERRERLSHARRTSASARSGSSSRARGTCAPRTAGTGRSSGPRA